MPRIGRLKLAHLTPAKVEAFRDDLLAKLSRPLARKVLTSLKSLLKVAKHAHVAADVSIGRSKRGKRKLEVGRRHPDSGGGQAAARRPRPRLSVRVRTCW